MNERSQDNYIDLGSDDAEMFDPFAEDDDLVDDGTDVDVDDIDRDVEVDSDEDMTEQPSAGVKTQSSVAVPKQTKKVAIPANKAIARRTDSDDADADSDDESDEETDASDNPLENAIGAAEIKEAEKARQSIFEKLPMFEYAGAAEDIEDTSQTFDELRMAKTTDFPELEDGKRVSWTVEYGKISKSITDAKGATIAKVKSEIETSKAFIDALKKSKDKSPVCKIKPRVTAQSKGRVAIQNNGKAAPGYKGVFTNMAEVDAAGKAISIIPAKDGKVYEIRNTAIGRFVTPVTNCEVLSDVRAGYSPAFGIPRIPADLTMRIIAFFRHLAFNGDGKENEALVNIYWDTLNEEFSVDAPEQIVSKISVHSNINPDYHSERYIHFMDIHSHNSMKAFFSATDDADEKATRLYTVIGRLDKYFPEIKTRISNGGKFHEIDPAEVFEYIERPFPDEWRDKVSFRMQHEGVGNNYAGGNEVKVNGAGSNEVNKVNGAEGNGRQGGMSRTSYKAGFGCNADVEMGFADDSLWHLMNTFYLDLNTGHYCYDCLESNAMSNSGCYNHGRSCGCGNDCGNCLHQMHNNKDGAFV